MIIEGGIYPASAYDNAQQFQLALYTTGAGLNPSRTIYPGIPFYLSQARLLNLRDCVGFQVLGESDILGVDYKDGSAFEPISNTEIGWFTITLFDVDRKNDDPGFLVNYPLGGLLTTQNRIITFAKRRIDPNASYITLNQNAGLPNRIPLAFNFLFDQPMTFRL